MSKKPDFNSFTDDDMVVWFVELVNEMSDLTLERAIDELGADMREILRSNLARFDREE